jgi:hypothetical protein
MVELPKPQPVVALRQEQPIMTADGGEPSFVSQSSLGYIALGLGGAGLAVGAVTGIIAINRRQELDDIPCIEEVGELCYANNDPATVNAAFAAKDDLQTFATAATISFIAGGALAATGFLLLVTAPEDPPASAQAISVHPYVGFGSIGASGSF